MLLPGHRSGAAILLTGIVLLLFGQADLAATLCGVTLAWQTVIIGWAFVGRAVRSGNYQRDLSLIVAVMALTAAELTICVGLSSLSMFAALAAVIAIWVRWRNQPRTTTHNYASRFAAPLCFVVLLAAGWGALHQPERAWQPDPILTQTADEGDDAGGEMISERHSDLIAEAEQMGLAMAPILILMLCVWGLSRLPGVR